MSDRSKSSTATSSDSKDRVENDSHAVNAAHVRFDDIVRVASFVVARLTMRTQIDVGIDAGANWA